MNSTATAVAFRGRSGPRVGDSQRVSQAARQAELVRGAMVRNTQSISPMPDPLPPADPLGLAGLAAIGLAIVVGELAKQFNELARLANEWDWGLLNLNRGKRLAPNSNVPMEHYLRHEPGRAVAYEAKWEVRPHPIYFTGPLQTFQLYYNPADNSYGEIYTDRALELFFHKPTDVHGSGLFWQNFPAIRWYDPRDGVTKVSKFITGNGASDEKVSVYPKDGNPANWTEFPDGTVTAGLVFPALPQIKTAEMPSVLGLEPKPVIKSAEVLPEGAPVVPVVTPSPALVTTAQVTRTNFYMPDRLPAPLAPPATQTRTTTGAGTLVAPAALPVEQTATDLRRYGSQVITAIGVRPDLASIAEEVGRMERKMGIMLEGADTSPDWLDGVLNSMLNRLVNALVDALVVDVPAATYQFSAPCDYDANGNRLVLNKQIAAADFEPAIVARLDAIADAIKVLKWWKTPTCRVNPPQSNVTVTAEEFDPEA
jgi:hypothetical protein